MWWRRGAGLAPRAPAQQRCDSPACQHRAHQRAHHVTEERVRRDLERHDVLVDLEPARALDDAREALVLGVGRGECTEVVLADERLGTFVQCGDVERPRMPQRAAGLERRALTTPARAQR